MAVIVATRHAVVVPSDVATFSDPQAIFVGVGGDIALKLIGNSTVVVYKNIANGTFLPVLAERVMSTDTTATDIVRMEN